ncbi:hypothetical protein ACFOKF_16580 [Sphingobium rhizovicinum]|uniref:Bacteriophage tail tape measure N-terminal domain-containing protein n=1 Tax=Sphingobium rhizovicinum TaxID=432308 RepID=A0ABV7NH31_9SPHN
MAQPKVAIRLGTEGKDDVVRDFKAVGDAGDAAANRLSRGFDKAASDFEASERRLSAASQKIAAIMPKTAIQMQIESNSGSTALGGRMERQLGSGSYSSMQEGSARISAAAIRELLDEQERQIQIAARIRAELDPLWAAQQRYNAALLEAREAHAAGALSADLLRQKELALKEALDVVTLAHRGGNVSAGQYKAGMQQLGFQMQDLGVQLAMAAGSGNVMKGVMTALAMQGPQVVSAIALMRGSAGGFIGFLAGPWGAGIMAAVSVLAVLGSEFLSSGDSATKATKQVDGYTAALRRLAGAQGQVTANDLGMGKVRVEELRGQLTRLDAEIAASTGSRAAAQRRLELQERRGTLADQLSSAEATVGGAEIAWNNRLKLDALGLADKENAKKDRAAASAARAAQREAQREAEKAAREEAQRAQRTQTENNRWANDYDTSAFARAGLAKEGEKLADQQKLIKSMNDDISAGTMLLNVEWETRGKSRLEIEAAVELKRYEIDLQRQGLDLSSAEAQALIARKAGQIAFTQALDASVDKMTALRDIGVDVAGNVLNPENWTSWKNVALSAIGDVTSAFWKLAVVNPIQNKISGGNLPTIGSLFGLFKGSGASAGGSAIGNEYTSAGTHLVGENGPEIVELPQGAKVMTASETRRVMGANDNGLQVRVIKGDMFDVEVTRISAGVSVDTVASAAPMIAVGASNGAQQAVAKRNGRRLA